MRDDIFIIGGRGYLGRRAVAVLRQHGDDVQSAGRRAVGGVDVVIDLGRPETWQAIPAGAVVVNASSSHDADPAPFAAWCLARGVLLLECSSDRAVVERLLARRGRAAAGTVVLGAGIYTGLSNLLGAAAVTAARAGRADVDVTLELGICSTPLSGAGEATIALMLDAMALPATAVRDGAVVTVEAAASGPRLPFPTGTRRTLTFSLPEVPMLAASSGVRSLALGFAPAPAPLWGVFRLTPTAVLRSSLYRALCRPWFRLLRRVLRRDAPGRVELVARARARGREAVVDLAAADGFAVAGAAIATLARCLRATRPLGRGVVTIDEVVTLDDALAGLRELGAGDALRVTCRSLPTAATGAAEGVSG